MNQEIDEIDSKSVIKSAKRYLISNKITDLPVQFYCYNNKQICHFCTFCEECL